MTKNIKLKNGGDIVPFKKFSKKENEVWKILCERQLKTLEGKVSNIWLRGWKILGMDKENIPDFVEINKKLKELTGWEVIMTNIEYEESSLWISALANKKHRITNFIRTKKDLDYTPLPDIFHDVFGHLPFLAIPEYARIIEKFGKAMQKTKTEEEKEKIIRLGWYGYEFGFIKEEGELKAFGTGLISSDGELRNALSVNFPKAEYSRSIVENTAISPHEFHKKLFILENLEQLEKVVDKLLK